MLNLDQYRVHELETGKVAMKDYLTSIMHNVLIVQRSMLSSEVLTNNTIDLLAAGPGDIIQSVACSSNDNRPETYLNSFRGIAGLIGCIAGYASMFSVSHLRHVHIKFL